MDGYMGMVLVGGTSRWYILGLPGMFRGMFRYVSGVCFACDQRVCFWGCVALNHWRHASLLSSSLVLCPGVLSLSARLACQRPLR